MYTQFFQLKQVPFSIAPDPRYLFMSERHREALAHLLYGIGSGGGFVLLTGEIGAGKTTVCRCLLEQIPEHCRVAYIFNPKLSANELLQSICEEFHIQAFSGKNGALTAKHYVDALNAYLLRSHAEGKNNVLIIDEAQNLSAEVLEQLRLLTNLETNERKLLQVILIGQPELRSILARPELEQLAQRIIARYHLAALSLQETTGYVQYRLAVAGATGIPLFPLDLMPRIQRLTRGVPRRINLLCDRALLGAYVANLPQVTQNILDKAAQEIFGDLPVQEKKAWQRNGLAAAGIIAGVLLTGTAGWALHYIGNLPQGAVKAAMAAPAGWLYSASKLVTDSGSPTTLQISAQSAALSPAPSSAVAASQSLAAGTPLADLSSLLQDAQRDESAAYHLLGQLWGVALKQDSPCQVAQSRNVHCYRSKGGLAALKHLNRPAILTLRDHRNTAYYAVLIGLTADSAALRFAGARSDVIVSLSALARHFEGEFVTFWRAPPGYYKGIAFGDKGELVNWLAGQLARLPGETTLEPGQPFGDAMAKQVRDFQASQGVPADGIAGPLTLMLLNKAIGIPEPRLYIDQTDQTVAAVMPGK